MGFPLIYHKFHSTNQSLTQTSSILLTEEKIYMNLIFLFTYLVVKNRLQKVQSHLWLKTF